MIGWRAELLFGLVAACSTDLVLPDASGFSEPRDGEGRLVVAVTRDARLLHAGKVISLDDLSEAVEAAGYDARVVFRVDAKARWCHVQWAVAVVAEHSQEPVAFVVEKGGKERSLIAYSDQPPWENVYSRYIGFGGRITVSVEGGGVYRLGKRGTHSLRQLRAWIRDVGQMAAPAVFAVGARLQTPARECLRVLNEFHEAGEKAVLFALEAPHPWVREQRPLPEPRQNYLLTPWSIFGPHSRKDIAPLCLPVAPMGEEDRDDDPDDRAIINLDRKGRILSGSLPVSLDDLQKILERHKRVYDLRQKAKGKRGFEQAADGEQFSSLYVLLRADRDAPWLQVKWILAMLDEARFFKLQFAVMKSADVSYTQEEAQRLGVPRRDVLPGVGRTLDAKLKCFRRTSRPGPVDLFIDVDVAHEDLQTMRERIEKEFKRVRGLNRRISGRIRAPDETPLRQVIAVINAFNEIMCEKIDFVAVAPAPAEIRRAKRLPR